MRRWQSVVGARCSFMRRSCATSSANSVDITRPPYYRKPHQYYKPKHMLQEEFPNAADVSGSGLRLFDYYKTAEMVHQLPTIKEKIDFVSPYERPWTRAERTWRRDWHPSLMSPRKAWGLPLVPAYFDCLEYYKYITKTRIQVGSLDEYYKALVPPTASYEKAMIESLSSILCSTRFDSEEERVSAIITSLMDEAVQSIAHNVARLSDYRMAYDVQSESFWIRAGFMFLYDEKQLGSHEVTRNIRNTSKFIGDDRRKLGELAFVFRDRLASQLRSREPPAPLFSLESNKAIQPVFDDNVNINEDVLFSPKVMNFWPDVEPLWQCPGYFAESGETHSYARLAGKSLADLDKRCQYWGADGQERIQMWIDGVKAQAVASLFTTLNAQAHTHGFTQYTDLTRPFTSQLFLTNGVDFVFAIGQLNTIAINIECDGFDNQKSNVCCVEAPIKLYDDMKDGKFFYKNGDDYKEGLNPMVLIRILQMILRD